MRKILPMLAVCSLCLAGCGDDDGGTNQNNSTPSGICGDGVLDPDEECDQGASNSDTTVDGCRTDCREAFCGDWVVDSGEGCDEGPQTGGAGSPCHADCTLNVCGDGLVGGDETCDDGNTQSGDGCRGDCLQDETLCGDGVLDAGEECDQGELNSDVVPNACRTDCRPSACGDGVIDTGERCDDGNTTDDLDCSATCQHFCGDGVLNPVLGEECDDGGLNGDVPALCQTDCTLWQNECGDGFVSGNEGCDDGDTDDGDGCSATCEVEPRWACSGAISSTCSCAGHNYGADCAGCVVFVNVDAANLQPDGKSWATAFTSLQPAIDAAEADGPGCEVWVAEGNYFVYETSPLNTVTLRSGVSVYGGFAGTETARSERNWTTHPTVIDGHQFSGSDHRVFHVFVAEGTDDATLDGITITGGMADSAVEQRERRGSGLFVYGADLALVNCTVAENEGYHNTKGGGMYAYGARLTLQNTTFENNYLLAERSGGTPQGAGAYVSRSTLTMEGCRFVNNVADTTYVNAYGHGAGLLLYETPCTAVDCHFESNRGVNGYGGAIRAQDSDLTLTNSTFLNNEAERGGAVWIMNNTLDVDECTFAGNTADSGGAIDAAQDSGAITRSLFVGNDDTAISGGGLTISWCVFADNYSHYSGAITGGSLDISDTVFSGNVSGATANFDYGGAALRLSNGANTLDRIVFAGNSSDNFGGAIHIRSDQVFTNLVLVGNVAGNQGGAVYAFTASPTFVNLTLAHNRASSGGSGLYTEGFPVPQEQPVVVNSIVWHNVTDGVLAGPNSAPDVTYTVIQDGTAGTENIFTDPQFDDQIPPGGTWSGVAPVPAAYQTALTDDGAGWTPSALAGLFVKPSATDDRWFYIVDNTADTIFVWGDLTAFVSAPDDYLLFSAALQPTSPAIDAAEGFLAPVRDASALERWNDTGEDDVFNCNSQPDCISWADLGAYEYRP